MYIALMDTTSCRKIAALALGVQDDCVTGEDLVAAQRAVFEVVEILKTPSSKVFSLEFEKRRGPFPTISPMRQERIEDILQCLMSPDRGVVRVARYIRTSKEEQNERLQIDATLDIIKARGWTIHDTYVDRGISGSKDRRPELDRLLKDAKDSKFNVVLVWRLDRFFRNLRHLLNTTNDLKERGIELVSVVENLDTATPQGRLLQNMLGSVAEFERDLASERTKAGLESARRRGAQIGRPRVHIDMEKARLLKSQGVSLRQSAKKLGVGAATLCRALKAPPPEPPEPPKKAKRYAAIDIEEARRLYDQGMGVKAIAKSLKVHYGTLHKQLVEVAKEEFEKGGESDACVD